ncbi:MAG: hypothetical protein LLG09_01840 [Negativicutes bacterium]|nr:hypothetical protein [Negativicutes bacterium]
MKKPKRMRTGSAPKRILLLCALIVLTFFLSPAAARLSLSKYVLEPKTYTISLTSAQQFPLTAMAPIEGTAQVGQLLTAGALTPADAMADATYQWFSSAAIDGSYTAISGATAASCTLSAAEYGRFIKVTVTGGDGYSGQLTSAAVGPVSAAPITIAALAGITVPVRGEVPDLTVTANAQYTAGISWSPADSPFKAYTVYTAAITITPNSGYTLDGVPENFFTVDGAAASHAANSGAVTAVFPRTAPAVINLAAIAGVTPPVIGATPVAGISATEQYTASITWSPAHSQFLTDTIYTATITLTAKTGYTLTGVAQNFFTVAGAAATNAADSGVVTAVFPITALLPISLPAIEGVTVPVKGALPAASVTATEQYTAAISWSPADSPFKANTVYTATISLTPKSGYTLAGVAENFFTVAGATAANAANSGLITAIFPATAKENLTGVNLSGTAIIGQQLTAVDLIPSGATATYQWQRCETIDGSYADIAEATDIAYTLVLADKNNYLRVAASGSGNYSATVYSSPSAKVSGIPLTGIGEISGTTRQYETLTAGACSPAEATVSYQWLRADSADGEYSEIVGATSSTYTLVFDDKNHYIKVRISGTGSYSGSVESVSSGPVVFAATAITAMAAINGTPYIGQTLTAGALTPAEATASYQWQQSTALNGTYTNISGATNSSYYLTAAALNQFYRVVATGSGTFSGTVSASIGPIKTAAQQITAIGAISGSTVSGQVLTAGTLTPAEATVTYQWQRSDLSGSIYTDLAGATSASYTLSDADLNCYLKVVATGYGAYTGTVISPRSSLVATSTQNITSIGAITGTAQVGSMLTAGAVAPTNATVTYQWQTADSLSGPFTDLSYATASSYTVTAANLGKYLRVKATGSGAYAASVESSAVGSVTACPLISITNISGTTVITYTVTAGTVTPAGATVSYQWQRSTNSGSTYSDILGATSASYTLVAADNNLTNTIYIRVAVTGILPYTGTVLSNYIVPKANTGGITAITAIADSIGLTEVFQSLTAGTVTPYGATVTYQWYRCDTASGTYAVVNGATSKTYNILGIDKGYFFKVEATGSGSYSGTVWSRYAGPITAAPLSAIGSISGTATIGQVITAGNLTPSAATVNYQWQRSDLNGENYSDITGATSNTYTLTAGDENRYLKVTVTGFGYYSGTLTSLRTGPVLTNATPITALSAIDGIARVGQTLNAGTTTPLGATVTYQWQRCTEINGVYSNISGATTATYTLTPSDLNQYIKLVVHGAGIYATPAEGISSTALGPVAVCPITAVSNIIGKAEVDQILTAGTVTPYGATVSYQWQRYVNGSYAAISGATASTYTLVTADNTYYIRVAVSGISGYSGMVYSNNTGPVGSPNAISSISAITGVTKVSQVLTAGTVLPYGASVSYQWQNSSEADGTYANISGATSSSYTLTTADYGKYLKVIAEGTGVYFGEVISTPTDLISKGSITAISNISGSTISGQTLTAGAVTPLGATVTYQWQRSDTSGSNYTNITDATANTYLLTNADVACYLRVLVTGSQSYESSVTSLPTAVISPSGTVPTALISIAATGGTARVGQTLTAGAVSPSNATVTYQWQRSAGASDSAYANISGAVASSYVLTAADFGKYVRPVATGSGTFSGSVNPSGTSITLKQLVTAGNITGTPAVGETVVAGVLTPADATVTYQWQRASKNGTDYSNIAGATGRSYTIVDADDDGYLKVLIVGTGAYETNPTAGLLSAAYGRIEPYPFKITAISAITGISQVGQLLHAGATTPYGAAVTYQWLRKVAGAETYAEIIGATASSYTTTSSDYHAYIKVIATGAGSFSGWVESAPTALIAAAPLTAIGSISGTVATGQTITAGPLTPLDATVTYQWQRSDSSGLNFSNIANATEKTYLLGASDLNCSLKVIATGTGSYTGTVTSSAAGPVSATFQSLTSIGPITGTATVNQTLTAGAIVPTNASVTYQWKRADSSGGNYTDISGATNSQYTLTAADYGKFIKVVATGSGVYAGSVENAAVKGAIAACPITALGDFTGSCNIGQAFVAGVITPANATVTYQWYLSNSPNPQGWDLIGATTAAIVVPENKLGSGQGTNTVGYYLKLVVTGSGAFSGSLEKVSVAIGAKTSLTPLTAIGSIIGTTAPTQLVSAGSLTPNGATVTYQWLRCLTSDGTYETITAATSASYTIQNTDLGYYLKVSATGTGAYTGIVISGFKGPVIALSQTTPITAISDILYTTARNVTLTAGTVTPLLATVTYQWQVSSSISGSYTDIAGATANTYTIPLTQTYGYYFKVKATGSGSYTGTVTSNYTGPVVETPTPLTSVAINGTAQAGQTLTAAVQPTNATVTYQWQISTTVNGTYTDLAGATASTFLVTVVEYNYYLRVVAIGSGAYTGTVISASTDRIAAFPISAMAPIGGTAVVGNTITAGGLTPAAATGAYQWQISATGNAADFTDLAGATNATLALSANELGQYLRVSLTGSGAYSGSYTSAAVGPVVYAEAAPVAGNVGSTGSAQVGQTMSGYYTYSDLNGDLQGTSTYRWLADNTAISGATANTYLITAAELGKTIQFEVTPIALSGTLSGTAVRSTAGCAVVTADAPRANNVSISGSASVGQTLTGSYTYSDSNSDPEATSTFQWYADDTPISGATSLTYLLTIAESGKTIRFEVTPAAQSGTTPGAASRSLPTPAVLVEEMAPLALNVSILGTSMVGETLSVDYTYLDFNGDPEGDSQIQWYASDLSDGSQMLILAGNPNRTAISGATARTLVITAALQQKQIDVEVTPVATRGKKIGNPARSAKTNAVTTDISLLTINGVTAPVKGAVPVVSLAETTEYTLSLVWSPAVSTFAANTVYTATIQVTPKAGYSLAKVKHNSFTVTGAVAANAAHSGSVTAVFPATAKETLISVSISGNPVIGETLTMDQLLPANAAVTYQWQRSTAFDGSYSDIAGANTNQYVLTAEDDLQYLRLSVSGSGNFTGTLSSVSIGPVSTQGRVLNGITAIGGLPQVANLLTAGVLTPAGASATYQWQRCATIDGEYLAISGATGSSYLLTADDYQAYLKVVATGSAGFSGVITSAATAQVQKGPLTAISDVIGTTVIGQILTAGTVTPLGASVTYQWQRCGTTGAYVDITGATASSYQITGSDSQFFLRVIATGTGVYTGSVTSDSTVHKVTQSSVALISLAATGGSAQVGRTLTAGELTPYEATVTYQWYRSAAAEGEYEPIAGATNAAYTLTAADCNQYLRVTVLGSGLYTGSLTSIAVGPATTGVVSAIAAIKGTTMIGQTLSAGALTPFEASVTYQWQKCRTAGGSYTDISGATSATYTITAADFNYYLRVVATGYGSYTAAATSAPTAGRVGSAHTPISKIGAIVGLAQVGNTISAGALTPAAATATYQWLRCSTEEGSYEPIAGATGSTYRLTAADYNCYMKVTAVGSGSYSGSVTSAVSALTAACPITSISDIIGTTTAGETLTAGTVTPLGATVTYQWQTSDATDETRFIDIAGATAQNFIVLAEYNYRYLRVLVTGSGAYSGTIASAQTTSRVVGTVLATLSGMDPIVGTAKVGNTLTAGNLSPTGTDATYQWQKCTVADGTYENIPGAADNSYRLTAADYPYYLRVVATASGSYIGKVVSAVAGPVEAGTITALGPIGGMAAIGQTVSVGTIEPGGATVTYQWQISPMADGVYTDLTGETFAHYTISEADYNSYLKVTVTGSGSYSGSISSAPSSKISNASFALTALEAIHGTAAVAQQLTAGAVSPAGATVTYQWQKCLTPDGQYEDIVGATKSYYLLTASEYGYYIRLAVNGSGNYGGSLSSLATGLVQKAAVTAIADLIGSTKIGLTLTAGELTPGGATADYQWQRSDTGNGLTYSDIPGATAINYTMTGEDSYRYLRVIATGKGAYSGTVISESTVARVSAGELTPLQSIAAISGSAVVGQTLTAGGLTPHGTATYQWQRCATADGSFENISGASKTTYVLTAADLNYFFKVVATGSGVYTGSVISSATAGVTACPITGIGATAGSLAVGQALTAGTAQPATANLTYQWQRSAAVGGAYLNIDGAQQNTYVLQAEDAGYYLKVVITGVNGYTGSITSAYCGPVGLTLTPITAITAINGTAQVGSVLTAGSLTPGNATVTYQWQRAAEANGTYDDIPGATAKNYTLQVEDYAKYIRVRATGSGSYAETVTSAATGQVLACPLTAISDLIGTTRQGQTLTAGSVSPLGATVTYEWQVTRTPGSGTPAVISGATAATYYIADLRYSQNYIRVVATGTGAYTGSVASAYSVSIITGGTATALSSIAATSGGAQVGSLLTAGVLSPSGATATYQWQKCETENGVYANIPGAAGKTYRLSAADYNYYLKVVATGSGSYSGVKTSEAVGPVSLAPVTAIGPIRGSTIKGETLTAGSITPLAATVNYQWQSSNASNGSFTDIAGETQESYTMQESDLNRYLRVMVSGTGSYFGSVYSVATGPVVNSAIPITAFGPISGTVQVGQLLTAGSVTPNGASVTYQWQRANSAGGSYSDIAGATAASYMLTADDYNKFLVVKVSGAGVYNGTQISAETAAVASCPITAISPIIGSTTEGQTLTAGTVLPLGATVTYQWQACQTPDSGPIDLINGAIANTYVVNLQYSWSFLRVVVTGSGAYSGTIESAYTTGRVTSAPATAISAMAAIQGTAQVGSQLTAGNLTPAAATATYQWQRGTASTGNFEDILGATDKNYTPTETDDSSYLRVIITGSGSYSGVKTSEAVGPVRAAEEAPFVSSVAISGTAQVGQTLTGNYTYSDVNGDLEGSSIFRWYADDTEIPGATELTYVLTVSELGKAIRFEVTPIAASGITSGTAVQSAATANVVAAETAPSVSLVSISGLLQVGKTLTGSYIYSDVNGDPEGSSIFRWFADDTEISGATERTYVLSANELGKAVRFEVTPVAASGILAGSAVLSEATAAVAETAAEAAPTADAVGISGTAQVGQTLTGNYTYSDVNGDLEGSSIFRWFADDTEISGATERTYVLSANELGKAIQFEVTPMAATGTSSGLAAISTATAAVLPAEAAPQATNVTISGMAQFGQTLTGNYSYSDVNGDLEGSSIFRWYADGVLITGAEAKTYLVTAAVIGAVLKFEVTPIAATGITAGSAVESAATAAVTAKPIDLTVISGITPPVKNAAPDLMVDATSQYTATIVWNPSPGDKFKKNIVYTAVISLTAAEGYTTIGIPDNYFSIAGAVTVTNSADSGTVSAIFPKTGND